MPSIIDDVDKLMEMSREELDEVLLDKKYNKALLRELVRRCLYKAKNYKKEYDYWFNVYCKMRQRE